MRRTLPALLATALILGLIGAAIASDRRQSPRRESAVLAAPPAQLPATEQLPATAHVDDAGETIGERVPAASGAVLAEMTRTLGTPRRVSREARRHARQRALALAKLRARLRAIAAAKAARERARLAALAPGTGTTANGYWFDSQAANVANSTPESNDEAAWLQGGRGGWVESSGFARAPANAPEAIRRVMQAGNLIARSPYLWGGGHGAWQDRGYDCSGSVSYALAAGGLLGYTQTSGQLMNWGEPGPGRWLTIYANGGHVFMYVAGLRFDTSGRAGDHSSRWQLAPRSAYGFVARHYPGL